MAEPLGKIEKPEAAEFAGKRKLCLVPLLFCGQSAPSEYAEKFKRYWEQVAEHIANLESKIGKVSHVYHESVILGGESGLKMVEKLNFSSYQIIKEKGESGAVFEATDDKALAEESLDWERFLIMGFISQKVAEMVSGFYLEASRKRYEHIARRIAETLKADEVGLLFIREDHMVPFPQEIEVFSVAPPALDEIHRWQRERLIAEEKKAKKDESAKPDK